MAADQVIRWSTAGAVIGDCRGRCGGVPTNTPTSSYGCTVRRWNARLVPLTVDGLIYASSMVLLDSARRKVPVPAPARWLLGLGIGATPAANAAHGLGHGPAGAAVAAWPAVVLVGGRMSC